MRELLDAMVSIDLSKIQRYGIELADRGVCTCTSARLTLVTFIFWGHSMEHAVAMEVIDKHLEANGVDDRARRQRLLVDPRILTRDHQSGNYRCAHVPEKYFTRHLQKCCFNLLYFFYPLRIACIFHGHPSNKSFIS